jgi:hypothetical protein
MGGGRDHWGDDRGTSFRVPAVLEDTSRSGACVRLKRPLAVGSRITIKWHREQFPAIARNCRTDGAEFLLGVRRETEIVSATKSASHRAAIDANPGRALKDPAEAAHAIAAPAQTLPPAEAAPAVPKPTPAPSRGQSRQLFRNAVTTTPPRPRKETHIQGTSLRPKG